MKVESNLIKCGEIFWYDFGKFMINCDLCLEKFNTGIDAYEHINQHFLNDKNLYKDDAEELKFIENKTEYTAPETELTAETETQELETIQESDTDPFAPDDYNLADDECTNEKVNKPTKCKKKTEKPPRKRRPFKWGLHSTWLAPVHCDICGKSMQKRKILNHLRTHTNLREFLCNICNKTFNTQANLKIHEVTHTGVKQFSCDYCGWQFYHPTNLKRHIRLHTSEKQYKCNVCHKEFTEPNSLKRHKRTHIGENSHYCDVCKKSLSYRTFREHKLRHARNLP